MHLILWRHAEAAEGSPDLERRLTPKGQRQARTMAGWLRARLPKDTRILVSPAVRTQETARALTSAYETVAGVAPDAAPDAVLAAAGWPEAGGAVLVVGHQPTLGEVAALLLAGEARPWTVRKGAIWWLTLRQRESQPQVVLRAVLGPEEAPDP